MFLQGVRGSVLFLSIFCSSSLITTPNHHIEETPPSRATPTKTRWLGYRPAASHY
jgi:hypothetical protein